MEHTQNADNAQRLLTLGHALVPVEYGFKKPVFDEWQNAVITADNLDLFFPPGEPRNIGIRNDRCNAVDVDVLDPDLAAELEGMMPEAWRDGLCRIGRPPKFAILLRPTADPVRLKKLVRFKAEPDKARTMKDGRHPPKKVELDVRTRATEHTVVFGRHPDTGADYYYRGRSVLEVPLADLPVLTQANAEQFLGDAEATFTEAGYIHKTKNAALREMYPGAAERPVLRPVQQSGATTAGGDRERVLEALRAGPNELDREGWVRLALSLQSVFGKDDDEMRQAFIDFSNLQPQETDTPERVWDTTSELSGELGIGTVRFLLKESGCDTSGIGFQFPDADLIDDGYDPRPLRMRISLGEDTSLPPWDDEADGTITMLLPKRMDDFGVDAEPPKFIVEQILPANVAALVVGI